MQERPDKMVLLMAIARFLMEEVRPALSADPRLAFRTLIAANLASIVASELGSDADLVTRDLARLEPLLHGDDAPDATSFEARHTLVKELTARLAARLREQDVSPEETARIAAVLLESLKAKLSVDNPRFDTALDIE